MSPRAKALRKVLNPPAVHGFKPYGPDKTDSKIDPVYLHLEEYEALRLCDYEHANHHSASQMMNVSRPTFTRIYASALRKIAAAFVEGRTIAIEGGKVYFDSDWYHCSTCNCNFNNPDKGNEITECPLCGSTSFDAVEEEEDNKKPSMGRCDDYCVCKACGYEIKHIRGVPCSGMICPECNGQMRRKRKDECS